MTAFQTSSAASAPRRHHCDNIVSATSMPVLCHRYYRKTSTYSRLYQLLISSSSVPIDGVLTSEDIVIGVLLGLCLAFLAAFLQGQGSQNDIVLWKNKDQENKDPIADSGNADGENIVDKGEADAIVFDGDSWREISRPENYVFYNQKIKQARSDNNNKKNGASSTSERSEKAWVLVALLVLFVPIFSIEFFFALSRQVLCGGSSFEMMAAPSSSQWANYLCSPV